MEQEKKFYTLIVFSENFAGLLNQVTAVFTRRQVNIESLNVSASSIKGVHKYTITWLEHGGTDTGYHQTDRETHRRAPGSLFHGRRNLHPGSGAL